MRIYYLPNSFILSSCLWLILALTSVNVFAQERTSLGQWTSYLAHNEGQATAIKGNTAYLLSKIGLASYDLQTHVYREYTKIDGLSGTDPVALYYDSTNNYIFIAYSNGIIDYFSDISDIKTILDINLSANVINKKIYHITSLENLIYFSTDFGIYVYDIAKQETRYNYFKIEENLASTPVLQHVIFDERLWVIVKDKGLYSADLNSPNLADGSVWRKEINRKGLSAQKTLKVTANKNYLYCSTLDTLYQYAADLDTFIKVMDTTIVPSGTQYKFLGNFLHGLAFIADDNTVYYYYESADSLTPRMVFASPEYFSEAPNGEFSCVADKFYGLLVYINGTRDRIFDKPFKVNSNVCQDLAIENRELYLAPLGFSKANYNPQFNDWGLFYLDLVTKEWSALNRYNGGCNSTRVNGNFGKAFINPKDSMAYLASFENGLMSLKHGIRDTLWDKYNSCLTGITTDTEGLYNNIRVVGMDVDSKGNLWCAVYGAAKPITVFTPEGECIAISSPRETIGSTKELKDVVVDMFDNKWFVFPDGVLVYNENNTLNNPNDDDSRILSRNAGYGNLPEGSVTALKKDLDGNIWVGSTAGATVFYAYYDLYDPNVIVDATCPVYNYHCLLHEEYVTCIAIDGANRKWFGTNKSGVYLFSPDGAEQLLHFTQENSSLFDNGITDIEIDQFTGEVFIATNRGLISYKGDAILAKETNDALYAYPNPVRPSFSGSVCIYGTSYNADVKIITTSGSLVRQLFANGGQAIWDRCDQRGQKVQPGIYIILVTDPERTSANYTKLAIIDN